MGTDAEAGRTVGPEFRMETWRIGFSDLGI
jgi:hypothetical protein